MSTDARIDFHTRTASRPELVGNGKVVARGTASEWAFGGKLPLPPIFFPFQ